MLSALRMVLILPAVAVHRTLQDHLIKLAKLFQTPELLKNMFHLFVYLWLYFFCLHVVFGDPDEVKSVSVMEGDSVALHTHLTEVQRADMILWNFGSLNTFIVKINREAKKVSINDTLHDGMFRDRLQVDDQTGSLTITNITTNHTGLYQMTIRGRQTTSYRFNVTVYVCLPVPVIGREYTQSSQSSERSSVSNCSVLCSAVNVMHVSLSWYKGKSLLSSISVSEHSNINISLHLKCLDDSYTCVINNPITNQTQHLTTDDCHKCSEPSITLIQIVVICCVVGSLMIVTSLVIICICRKQKNTKQEDQTGDEEITYADPTFYKRQTHKSRSAVEDDVMYAAVMMKR